MQIIELYIRSQFLAQGTASATTTNKLVDASAAFTTLIKIGDVVENTTDNTTAKITAIDSAIQVTLDNDIMASGEIYRIYTDYVKMDLFKDESVSISDSIQDVRDISKIFTTFSQQFNLPASKNNNKFFKQYQDTDVLNSFDARFKADAIIKLNGVDFRKGTIRLNEVDLKDNKAYSYKVVFFGDIIEMKDLMQDDELSSLPFPESLNFTYDNATVLAKFESISDLDVAFPLVTHSKYFNINSNGEYRSGSDRLIFTDLKPALKIRKIIEAIQIKYNLTFSNDFFNTFNFKRIYMLLQRASGAVSNALTTGGILTVTNSLNDLTVTTANNIDVRPLSTGFIYRLSYNITLLATTPVTVRITSPNSQVYAEETFDTIATHNIQFEIFGNVPSNVFFTVESENTLTISNQTLGITRLQGLVNATYAFPNNTILSNFVVTRQLPQMKVIDFMTSLFKMYNLTAYKENGIIVVRSLQDYYNAGNTYDITEYVDVDKSSVSKLLQFKEIDFKFKSKKYFLAEFSDEIQGGDFGNLTYGNDEYDGGVYKVEVDFEKMMYERLNDSNGVLTNVIQGSLLDSNLEPTIGAPLLMYCSNTNPEGAIVWGGTGNPTPTNYKRPSNAGLFTNNTLNFGGEIDEAFLNFVPNSLFQNNYINYITSIFDKQARKTKVTAYLPLRILLKYNLNDTFIIANKSYRINTIKTNLLTNKTDLELFNVFTNSNETQNGINGSLPRMSDFASTAKGSTTIDTSWTAVSGAIRYWLYVDDQLAQKQSTTTYQFTGLESGTTYKLRGQVEYANNSFSRFQDIIATTT
tara:strand:+ start:1354 stop:3771 length:2418 start_codon:yes stop_codon:yes gene_type:complete